MTLADRLAALLDHLGLGTVHLAGQMSGDLAGLAAAHPGRIAGLLLCEATGIDAASFAAVAPRLTILAGDGGISARAAETVAPLLPGHRRVTLPGYAKPVWADSVADHAAAVAAALLALPGVPDRPGDGPRRGSVAGIDYRIEGSGPALLLAPMFLSAAQWEPALPALVPHRSVVLLSGRHLGGVALLEDRAASPSYRAMVTTLLDVMAPAAGETLLELGCGTGALTRLARRHTGAAVTGADLNRFFLAEAAALTDDPGIAFTEADAERLPFPDASFDHAFSVTVLEECDGDRALRELRRVVKPGGRVGVVVRAADLPHPFHLDLPAPLLDRVANRPPSVGPGGIADRSLYPRMHAAGFALLGCFPMLASCAGPEDAFFRYIESGVLARLDAGEIALWQAARDRAAATGMLFATRPHHCAVGRR